MDPSSLSLALSPILATHSPDLIMVPHSTTHWLHVSVGNHCDYVFNTTCRRINAFRMLGYIKATLLCLLLRPIILVSPFIIIIILAFSLLPSALTNYSSLFLTIPPALVYSDTSNSFYVSNRTVSGRFQT